MQRIALLVAKRLLVLAIGLFLAWLTAFRVFPFIDQGLPWGFAILATYCFVAYLVLPALVRVWQLVHRPTHVPTRSHARDGWALDPINIVIVARSERDLTRAMRKAGWHTADPATFTTTAKAVLAMATNRPYHNAPFGTHFLFGRKQDLGFQIPIGSSPRKRHHVRFWRMGTTFLENEHEHLGFWRTLLANFLPPKQKEVWVGAAVLDWGINLQMRTLQLDHGIQGDTTLEREFVVESLKDAGVLKDVIDIKSGEPLHTRHQGFRETIISDGYVKLCEIKRQLFPPADPPITKH